MRYASGLLSTHVTDSAPAPAAIRAKAPEQPPLRTNTWAPDDQTPPRRQWETEGFGQLWSRR